MGRYFGKKADGQALFLKSHLPKNVASVVSSCIADHEKVAQFAQEERQIREENVRLQRKLQLEMDRREALCRHLSESESSLEMDEERWVPPKVGTVD